MTRSPIRRGGPIAAVLTAVLLITGCSDTAQDPADEPTAAEPTTWSPPANPEIVDEDGFWRANTLPPAVAQTTAQTPIAEADGELGSAKVEVLGLDSDGENARLTLAWLPPVEGPAVGSRSIAAKADQVLDRPWARLVDRAASEVLPPLQTEGGAGTADLAAPPQIREAGDDDELGRAGCACSGVSGKSEAQSPQPEETELIFIDFPAPSGDAVDLVLGEWIAPLHDVPVSQGEPFPAPEDELSRYQLGFQYDSPADAYGSGAEVARRLGLQATSESWTGVSTSDRGGERELSISADVLFEVDEDTLDGEARGVVAEVAETLNAEASGQTVVIEGHTDDQGADDYNQGLSERRADAVQQELSGQLDSGITLETEGFGRTQPLVPNVDADGEPIDENRAKNRRVGFRYAPQSESTGVIDAGGEQADLPIAEEIDTAPGALQSVMIAAPEDSRGEREDIRFDVLSVEREGDRVQIAYGVRAAADGAFGEVLYRLDDGTTHFGRNPQGYGSGPSAVNISIGDVSAEVEHQPVMAGAEGCLCTEVTPSRTQLGSTAVPLFAEYRLPESFAGEVVVRVPEGGQFALNSDVVDQLQNG